MHIKPEGMTQFDVFHTFVENSVSLYFSELYLKEPKSEIHQKMPVLVNSIFLTPR